MDNLQTDNKDLVLKKLDRSIKYTSWLLRLYFIVPTIFIVCISLLLALDSARYKQGDFTGVAILLCIIYSSVSITVLMGMLMIIKKFSKKSLLNGIFCTIIIGLSFIDSFNLELSHSMNDVWAKTINILLFIGILISIFNLWSVKKYKKISPDTGEEDRLTEIIVFALFMIPLLAFSLPVIMR